MNQAIHKAVRSKYGAVAESGLSTHHDGVRAVAEAFGYTPEELASIPAEAKMGLSCGNPIATARLKPGEVVVDLGSGGGLDVLLAAQRIGPYGRAIGIDMTDEMLELARRNAAKAGATSVEFHKATIDQLPLGNDAVDCVISNCVINLSSDKDRVISEAFRVLKPGGRFAVSDVVVRGNDIPEAVRRSMELWVGCVAGALEEGSYREKLAAAGFEHVDVEPTRIYRAADARHFLDEAGITDDAVLADIDGRFMSAFVRAQKPLGSRRECCSSTCCA